MGTRGRLRPVPVVALLAAALLAGCADPPAASVHAPATSAAEPPSSTDVAPGTAAVLGVVTDEGLVPIPGALAGIRDRTQATDADGRFAFYGLTPGDATLRVTRDGYVDKGQTLRLLDGQRLDLRIKLDPLPSEDPHVRTVILDGFLACSAPGSIYLDENPCPDPLQAGQKDRFNVSFELRGLESVLWELTYRSTLPAGAAERLGWLDLQVRGDGDRPLLGQAGFQYAQLLAAPKEILPQDRPVEQPVTNVFVRALPQNFGDTQDYEHPDNLTRGATGSYAYQQPVTVYVSFAYFRTLQAGDSFAAPR